MSHQQDGSIDESDLAPTQTAGYRVGEQKTIDELKNLDKDDEALNRWKQSLLSGPGADAAAGGKATVRELAGWMRLQPNREGSTYTDLRLAMNAYRLRWSRSGCSQKTSKLP